jgi:hypothetical protein
MHFVVRFSLVRTCPYGSRHTVPAPRLTFHALLSGIFECRSQPRVKLHSQSVQRHRHQVVLTYSKYDVHQLLDIVVLIETLPR